MVSRGDFDNFDPKFSAMKPSSKYLALSVLVFCFLVLVYSCADKAKASPAANSTINNDISLEETKPKKELSKNFKAYWYAGEAEITSYDLKQARYGELRDGNAVLIYVTEPFLADVQVKADRNGSDNVNVLKLNSTKNYLTGIYPYSIMSSSFYPVSDDQHAIKISTSVQEWCGHVYSQLNNREEFEYTSHSYFEGEADQELTLSKNWLENEIWNKIRVNPTDLPTGDVEMIPSLEYLRMAHKPVKAHKAKAKIETSNGIVSYTIEYPELQRSLSIDFTETFPYSIESWTETFKSGYGPNAKTLTSTATKKKVLKTPYWRQNSVENEVLRQELEL